MQCNADSALAATYRCTGALACIDETMMCTDADDVRNSSSSHAHCCSPIASTCAAEGALHTAWHRCKPIV